MRKIALLALLIMIYAQIGYCAEVSLLDEKDTQDSTILNEEQENKSLEVEDNKEIDINNDKFNQMNDFVNEEDEKLKEIKLLDLDLQRADLELKRKEIEQKINQLDKVESFPLMKEHDQNAESVVILPSIKLLSIFISDLNKKAVISVNGVNSTVIEGQHIDSFLVKAIDSRKIVLQFSDGQIKELFFS